MDINGRIKVGGQSYIYAVDSIDLDGKITCNTDNLLNLGSNSLIRVQGTQSAQGGIQLYGGAISNNGTIEGNVELKVPENKAENDKDTVKPEENRTDSDTDTVKPEENRTDSDKDTVKPNGNVSDLVGHEQQARSDAASADNAIHAEVPKAADTALQTIEAMPEPAVADEEALAEGISFHRA